MCGFSEEFNQCDEKKKPHTHFMVAFLFYENKILAFLIPFFFFFWVPSKVLILSTILRVEIAKLSSLFVCLLFYIMHVLTKIKFKKLMSC